MPKALPFAADTLFCLYVPLLLLIHDSVHRFSPALLRVCTYARMHRFGRTLHCIIMQGGHHVVERSLSGVRQPGQTHPHEGRQGGGALHAEARRAQAGGGAGGVETERAVLLMRGVREGRVWRCRGLVDTLLGLGCL